MCLNKEKLIFLDHEMNVDFVDLAVIWTWTSSYITNQAKLFGLCAVSIQIMLTQTEVTWYKICTHSLEHAQYKYENTFRAVM